ncbi:MAG: glutamate--tRNA ligase [Vicinamibacterales bacterium]|jgi:glutamyl-tRNA synthetase|nr:glutamate--tRNA ligase [Vicinamibacterales bacterium]
MTVRTRFAPSPTGYLHIGGVRTALFNWLFARGHGGQFLLRIDDTDAERNIAEALQPILDGFRWLGLDWDEGPEVDGPHAPYYQSQRGDRYRAAVDQLLARGAAYRDYATTEEIQAEREAAQREKRRFQYSRRWMAESPAQEAAFKAEGRRASVRLKMPREGVCAFHDLVRGDVEFEWALEQDHVVQRADGTCLYHLASAVDDHDFAITHVIRAIEHLSNTPRQMFIATALGYALPAFAHLPYVAEPGSAEKLSKRKLSKYLKHHEFKKIHDHGADIAAALGLGVTPETFNPVVVDFYREVGFEPDALVNYLLLLGWSLDDRTETFTREQMVEHFSLERVNRSAASFDPQKLLAFQERRMQALSLDARVARTCPFLERAGLIDTPPTDAQRSRLGLVVDAAADRIKVAGDILSYPEFFQADDRVAYDEKALDKRVRKDGVEPLLRRCRDRLAAAEPFEADSLEAALHHFVEVEGIKIGQIIHAVRVAVTGKAVGFGLFQGLAILGRDACLARIDRTLERLKPEA